MYKKNWYEQKTGMTKYVCPKCGSFAYFTDNEAAEFEGFVGCDVCESPMITQEAMNKAQTMIEFYQDSIKVNAIQPFIQGGIMLKFGTRVKIAENGRHETETFPTAVIVGEGIKLQFNQEHHRYIAVFEGVNHKNIMAKLYTEEIAEVLEVLPIEEAAIIYREAR